MTGQKDYCRVEAGDNIGLAGIVVMEMERNAEIRDI